MNIAVCEDNAVDRAAICEYISRYCEEGCFVCGIHVFENGEALLDAFSPGKFDAIFLDIFMGGMTGMQAAQKIRAADSACALIFITVSEDYIRLSFSVQVTSYVVKPICPEEMAAALTACRHIFLKNARYIEVKSDYQNIKIPLIRIYYAERKDRLTLFHTTEGVIQTYMPIDEVEKTLGGSPFLRCHRAFIINMNHITDTKQYDFLMRNGQWVPMRKNGRKELRNVVSDFYTNRMFEVGETLWART